MNIYLALVQSVNLYGVSILEGTYNNHLWKLHVKINCIIKYVFNVHKLLLY